MSAARLAAALERAEGALLAGLLLIMLALAALAMVLRWMGTGLAWIDPVLRYGVLWVAVLGGLGAVGARRHIQIDAFSRLLPAAGRALLVRLTDLISAFVCATLAWSGGRFVLDERAAGTQAFGGVPLWLLELILPVGMALVALRYLLQLLLPVAPAPTPSAEPLP